MFNKLSNQQKGSFLAFVGVMFITPDSLFIRLSNIDTWSLLFYRGAIPFLVVLSGLLLDKSTYVKKNDLIEKICSGQMHISFAYAEAGKSYDYLSAKTSLSSDYVLNGTKTLVLNGACSDKLLVTCTSDDTLKIIILDSTTQGVSINSFSTIDGQSCAEISFENVKLDDGCLIASGDEALELIKSTINLATLCICAEAVGCMQSCYSKTLQYTKEREQFGQPISSFQVLQHRMVAVSYTHLTLPTNREV